MRGGGALSWGRGRAGEAGPCCRGRGAILEGVCVQFWVLARGVLLRWESCQARRRQLHCGLRGHFLSSPRPREGVARGPTPELPALPAAPLPRRPPSWSRRGLLRAVGSDKPRPVGPPAKPGGAGRGAALPSPWQRPVPACPARLQSRAVQAPPLRRSRVFPGTRGWGPRLPILRCSPRPFRRWVLGELAWVRALLAEPGNPMSGAVDRRLGQWGGCTLPHSRCRGGH